MYWSNQIKHEANILTREIGDNFFDGSLIPLAITNKQYKECGLNDTNQLGEVTEYYSLGDLSNILHTPVPFLREDFFYKFDSKDNIFYPVSHSENFRYVHQRNNFRMIFNKITERILKLIEHDSDSSQPSSTPKSNQTISVSVLNKRKSEESIERANSNQQQQQEQPFSYQSAESQPKRINSGGSMRTEAIINNNQARVHHHHHPEQQSFRNQSTQPQVVKTNSNINYFRVSTKTEPKNNFQRMRKPGQF